MNYINVGKENSSTIDIYYEDYGTGNPVVDTWLAVESSLLGETGTGFDGCRLSGHCL